MSHTSPIEQRARTWLGEAVRARDTVTVSALRTVLSAIAHAEAVPAVELDTASGSEHVAGGVQGVGAAEVARRELDEAEVGAVVRAEIDERRVAIDALGGRGERAERLRAEVVVLDSLIGAGVRRSGRPGRGT